MSVKAISAASGFLGLFLGVTALYQVTTIKQTIEEPISFSDIADGDARIDSRIEAFIERKRTEAINQKLARYSAVDGDKSGEKLIYGNPDARLTIVTYSDLECPFCKKFHSTPKAIVDASKGAINWQFVHFPLSFHNPAALVEAHGTECSREVAGAKHAWAFLDEVFNVTRGNGSGVEDITRVANDVGVPIDAFRDCMRSGKYREPIQNAMEEAKRLGITSTPTTIVVDRATGNNTLIPGFVEAEDLVRAISEIGDKAKAGG